MYLLCLLSSAKAATQSSVSSSTDLKVDCSFALRSATLCCGLDFAAAELSVLDLKADGSHLLYVLLLVC